MATPMRSGSADHRAIVAYGAIGRDQRFTRGNPCPVCDGSDDDKRGRGERCTGFLSEDGRYAFCTREERAGHLPSHNTSPISYKHLLSGACRCGETHGGAIERPPIDLHIPRPASMSRSHQTSKLDRIHTYRDADGQPYMRVLRIGSGKDKRFIAQRPDGAGDWYDGLEGLTPILYRLPGLLAADPWAPVFVVEGEKCADDLITRAQLATCNPFGAGKWGRVPGAREALRGRHVVILPDNDEPGRAHAAQVASDLAGVAASVRIVALPGLADKGDVYDWLADGHTTNELRRLAAETPIITALLPPAQETNPASQDDTMGNARKTYSGYDALKAENDQLKDALRIAETSRLIAETSLVAARQELAWARRVMALPKEQLSPALKPAAIAVYAVLKTPRQRDDQDMEQVYRGKIASACGVSVQAAGGHLRALDKAGVITKRTVRLSFDRSETRITEGPLFDTPEAIPEREATWGGKRVKACPTCGSEDLETRITCRDCGSIIKRGDVNHIRVVEASPNDGEASMPTLMQDDTTPPYLIVDDLASLAPDALADTTDPASPTPAADASPDADSGDEYLGADAIPSAPDAKHNRALTALWAYQQSHGGEAPDERAWREQSCYGHAAQAVMAFSHVTAALMKAGLVRQDARYRYTLAAPTGGA